MLKQRLTGATAKVMAAQIGHEVVVAKLVGGDKVYVNIANDEGYTAIFMAAQEGDEPRFCRMRTS
jgi:ankyrin repeat protein